jgi:hypothetical protein
LSETVKGVIRLGLLADEATESIGGEGVGETTFSIDITDVDLDGGVVLGSDETVGGRAKKVVKLEGKSTRHNMYVFLYIQAYRVNTLCIYIYIHALFLLYSKYLPLARNVEIDDVTFRVLHFGIREREGNTLCHL